MRPLEYFGYININSLNISEFDKNTGNILLALSEEGNENCK